MEQKTEKPYFSWPASKPGPQTTPPPPGYKPVPGRTDQVVEIGYNQETGTRNHLDENHQNKTESKLIARPCPLWEEMKQHPFITTGIIVVLIAVVFAVLVLIFGWGWTGLTPYTSPPHPKDTDFQRGKTFWDWMQLLLVPIMLAIGVFLLNQFQKSREENATKQQTEREARINLMRRVRTVETTIMTARELLNAHRSAKTYSEQFAQLRLVRAEVREIAEDLKVWKPPLFGEQKVICTKLEGIAEYLDGGAKEYREHHNDVIKDQRARDPDKGQGDLLDVVNEKAKNGEMLWTKDFMDIESTEGDYQKKCIGELGQMKKKMRPAVNGD